MANKGVQNEETTKCKGSYTAEKEDVMATIVEYILTLKQGLARYGKQAEEATEKELVHIHNMNTLKSFDANKLLKEEKKKAIS